MSGDHLGAVEQPNLKPLPVWAPPVYLLHQRLVDVEGYVSVETNRYSVPVEEARSQLVLKAYPFHIEILDGTTLLARHLRNYEREQDLFEPLHYLPLLEQRPGAFDYARPMRQWRKDWPESYHHMLRILREK